MLKPITSAQRRALRAQLLHRVFSELPLVVKQRVPLTTAVATIGLQLIGTPSLNVAHGASTSLERKDAAMLALLAIEGATPRARVAALLWPDVDDEHARNSLRQRLFRMHRNAATDVVLSGDVLQLASHVAHDLAALPARLEADPHAAAGELLGNLDFADCAELADWVDLAREQWRTTRRDALAEIAGRLEGERQIARCLLYAERLVADDPFMEHAHRRLMRLHYLRGDRSAALAAYEQARAVLKRELQVEPGRETEDLAALIRNSGAPAPGPGAAVEAARPRPVAVLRPPRLVGRDAQWEQLRQAHAAHRVVLVSGEPGIGKTRLITDFAASLERTAVFGARPGDARVPYALAARMIRGLVRQCGPPGTAWVAAELARVAPELGQSPAGNLEPLRLRQATLEAMEQWRAVGVELLALDDLHFADEATLEMLPGLTASVIPAGAGDASEIAVPPSERPRARITWLLGARSADLPSSVAQWLTSHHEESALAVELGPLTLDAVERLLESLAIPDFDVAAWAAPLARHTGGNPMFILETLIALLAQGPLALRGAQIKLPAPNNVAQLIERRLAQLSPQALKLARVAAVAGQDFSVELAGAVLGQHMLDLSDAWRELEVANVIRGNAFAHDLIFEATLRCVPAPIACALHKDVAIWLESHGEAPGRTAHHFEVGGDLARSAQCWLAAADLALKASRIGDQVLALKRAAELFERIGDRAQAFGALFKLSDAITYVKLGGEATDVSQRLLAAATTDSERLQAIESLLLALNQVGEYARSERFAREGMALARRLNRPDSEYSIAGNLGIALISTGAVDEGVAVFESQRAWAEASSDPELRRTFTADYATLLHRADRPHEARPLLEQAVRDALATRRHDHARMLGMLLGQALQALGMTSQALAAFEEARRLRDHIGDEAGAHPVDDLMLGALHTDLGNFGSALAALSAALAQFQHGASAAWVARCETHLARLYLILGQPARSRQCMTELAPDMLAWIRADRLWIEAQIAAALGKPARPLLDRAAQLIGDGGRASTRWTIELALARLAPPQEAAARCEAVASAAEARHFNAVRVHALALHAQAAARSGDAKDGVCSALAVASSLEHTAPDSIYGPEALVLAADALSAAHEHEAARAAQARARQWLNRARQSVPPEFLDSFLNRNLVNRAILTAAR
jgi:DNA-binding SARP family transcriptional activator/tetratricopeptide (TPR) repeat protein